MTLLLRSTKVYLESLSMNLIAKSYQKIFNTTEEKSIELAKMTRGYAFAYQLFGKIMWSKDTLDITDEVLDEYDELLAEMSYDKIYFDLPENEKLALKSFITKEEVFSSNALSVYKNRLSKRGIIDKNSREIKFLLPRFENFLENKIKFDL